MGHQYEMMTNVLFPSWRRLAFCWATRPPRHLCHLDELNSTLAAEFNAAAESSYGLESADETLHRVGSVSAYSLNNN
ncbi:unnamed protein product [Peronospora effusa]|nr:unnamed protein product [Peronospora effusa]